MCLGDCVDYSQLTPKVHTTYASGDGYAPDGRLQPAPLAGCAGLSQEELAAKTGLGRSYISGIEGGRRNPTVIALNEIAVEAAPPKRPDRTYPWLRTRSMPMAMSSVLTPTLDTRG